MDPYLEYTDAPRVDAVTAKQGFTVIELLSAVAIIAIALVVALPGMTAMLRSNNLTASTNNFIAALNFARSEAIKRSMRVTLRKSAAQWEGGWEVFTDNASGGGYYGIKDGADETLKTYAALPEGYTLRGNNNFTNYVSFQENGGSSNMGSFALCANQSNSNTPQANAARLIIVNMAGRVRLGMDRNGNGIPEKNDGTDLTSCINP
jgi:type IV fimbrial biogenesis protein FimT